MNQPTTPNTVDDFLPLPEPDGTYADLDCWGHPIRRKSGGYTLAQVHAAILADRAQRTVAASEPLSAEMLKSVIRTVREYPDFDGETPFGTMMDQALAGEVPDLIEAIEAIAEGRGPSRQAPKAYMTNDAKGQCYSAEFLKRNSIAAGDMIPLFTHPTPTAAVSVDSPELQALAESWRYQPAGTREFMDAWDSLIAHIQALINQAAQKGNAK